MEQTGKRFTVTRKVYEMFAAETQDLTWSLLDEFVRVYCQSSVNEQIGCIQKYLVECSDMPRTSVKPLRMVNRKVRALREYEPAFETGYPLEKKPRDEQKKLKILIKRENKSAKRELKKDSQFIARKRLEERRSKDQEYKTKMKNGRNIQGTQNMESSFY